MQHFLDAAELGSLRSGSAGIVFGHQHMHIAAQFRSCGQSLMRSVLDRGVIVLGNEKNRHDQITPASSLSLATSSATDFTLTPAWRLGGSEVLIALRRGVGSTP